MADTEQKRAKRRPLLPRRISEAKLSGTAGRKLAGLLRHPLVSDLIAAGLVALAARLKKEPAGGGTAEPGKKAAAAASAKQVAKPTARPSAKPAPKAAKPTAKPRAAAKSESGAKPERAKPRAAKSS